MQWPIRFQCVGVCTATAFNYTYTTLEEIYTEFRPAPDTPTVRVTKVPGSVRTKLSERRTVMPGSKAAGTIILTKDSRRFPQQIQENTRIIHRFGHNHFVQNSNSSFINPPSIDALWSQILRASLNKRHAGS